MENKSRINESELEGKLAEAQRSKSIGSYFRDFGNNALYFAKSIEPSDKAMKVAILALATYAAMC